jgi:gliding motility-associated-like protein
VYFAEGAEQTYGVLASPEGENDTTYLHEGLQSLAGCYYVTAIDSVGNESAPSNLVCVDNCPSFELPNTFTPNGDGANDRFTPFKPFRFIDRIQLQIFDRWGGLVYETTDPAINWDGRDQRGKELPEGVYYYTGSVFEQRVEGSVERPEPLEGYIHLIRGNGQSNP